MSNFSLYGFMSSFILAASFIIIFLTLRIHIGLKGVSVPVFPLFIPRNQIIDYKVFSNILVLKRKREKDFTIAIEINDVNNVESAIRQLQDDNEND